MKKMITSIGFVIAMLIVLEGQAEAIAINNHDARQKTQKAQIIDGVVAGDLTKKEVATLRKEQRVMTSAVRVAEADGVVTRREAKKLAILQNKARRDIRMQKNDRQVRRG